jgi:hypothetical protein
VHKRLYILLLVALIGLAPVVEVLAQDKPGIDVRAGFDGYFKLGSWVPIYAVVSNEGADIDGEIQYSVGSVVYKQRAVLPTRSRKQFTLYALVQYNARELTVELEEAERTLAEGSVRVQPVDQQDFLYAVASDDRASMSYLAGMPPRAQRRIHLAHLDLSDLPARANALRSIDMLILQSLDTSTLSDAQRDSLRGWVGMGGHLVICGGPNAELTASGLGDLLPVTIDGSETTRDLPGLGRFAGLPFMADVPAVLTRVSSIAPEAQVLVGSPERPLLVRRKLDAGYIDYLALDPDLEPIRSWVGNNDFWSKLSFSTPLTERYPEDAAWIRLQDVAANIPSLDVPSVFLVIGFLLLYVIVVGPLNLLVLKLTDRRAWAWVTVPVLIGLFSCVAYGVGYFSRGHRAIVSQVATVRAHIESKTAVVRGYAGLYSPSRQTYDVRLPDGALVQEARSSRMSMGSMGTGKLYVEQGSPPLVQDLEVDVGGMRGFEMRAVQPWTQVETDLTLTRGTGSQYHLEGTIHNAGDSAVEGCAILYQSQAVSIPDLAPGETQVVSADFRPTSALPPYMLIDDLLGSTPLGRKERRERERRRGVLEGVLNSSPAQIGPGSSGPALIGWLAENPLPVEVVGRASTSHATTLLVASLPVSSGDPETTVLPRGSLGWTYEGTGPIRSPYQLTHDTGVATFAYVLPPEAQGMSPEALFLHVDVQSGPGYGDAQPVPSTGYLPSVSVQDVATGKWEELSGLDWGANEIADPGRFFDEDGEIRIQVALDTIVWPVSIDFSLTIKQ